ncbi:S8 family peptidase [Clostridiaceae bacterium Marseille-Q4145]|nr:S8 family peptidase [Clostridiaceae bacterium Marseille-Q4145]
MDCRDAILSNDYIDFVWKMDVRPPEAEWMPYGYCGQYISPNFSVYYVKREEVFGKRTSLPVGDYGVTYCHTQMNTESLEASRILTIQNQPALQLKGSGVIIGFVDSGIALENQVFRMKDGKTRLIGLWDQTDQNGTIPEGFLYGSGYSREEIDQWLKEEKELFPGRDENGHGSKVAAIAAGSELAEENFVGAAPEADIAFVKLKEAKPFIRQLERIPQDCVAYEEADIMLGIRYLDLLAQREGKPLIICLALGSNSGGHTGETPLGLYLTYISRKSGRAVVAAGGNEGNKGHHFYGNLSLETGYLDVELKVGPGEREFQLNLWGNAPGLFVTEVVAPSGEKVSKISPQILSRERYDFVFEKTILDVQYELSESISGDERIMLAFQNPTAGIWTIRVYSVGNLETGFHMWLPVTGFISDETYFLRSDPDTTVTEPANAEGVLTFAGYDARTDSIWYDSGRGYTRVGAVVPDVAAPSVEVSTIDAKGRGSSLTGTSAAAALGAGACALLLEWGIVRQNAPAMDSVTIQRYLLRGARRSENYTYPNKTWGYGLLDLYGVFRAMRGI